VTLTPLGIRFLFLLREKNDPKKDRRQRQENIMKESDGKDGEMKLDLLNEGLPLTKTKAKEMMMTRKKE
jgi:hypothetical protein